MSWNYPAGAANDPYAPWNDPGEVMVTCPMCDGAGKATLNEFYNAKDMTEERWEALAKRVATREGIDPDSDELDDKVADLTVDCPDCDGDGDVEMHAFEAEERGLLDFADC